MFNYISQSPLIKCKKAEHVEYIYKQNVSPEVVYTLGLVMKDNIQYIMELY